ncbi:MAG: hypothetical protein EAZ29_09765 [Runella slithyformis]|nr:MAG: hypothetical protein EAZ29_09765 [Runella slithyformis]
MQEILDCTDFDIFEGSVTVRCVITQFINKESDGSVFFRPTANASSLEDLVNRELLATTKDILLSNNQNWALIFKLSSDVLNLIVKIRTNSEPLTKSFPSISQGLIAYDKYQGQDEATIKDRVFHSTQYRAGWKKWLWGEDVTPYSVKWNESEYVNYCEGIANPRDSKYFNGNRILIREITNPKIFAGFINEESYNDPALIIILDNEVGDIHLKVLLGILNSKLATFYHFNSSPKATKGAFPKILVGDIQNFPLPKSISSAEQQPFIVLVDAILLAKQRNNSTLNNSITQHPTTDLEAQIDELVYALYGLTEEEIAVVAG